MIYTKYQALFYRKVKRDATEFNVCDFMLLKVKPITCSSLTNAFFQQMMTLLGLLTDAGKPVVLVGENGCGKTAIVNDRIRTVCSGEVAEVLSLTIQANR